MIKINMITLNGELDIEIKKSEAQYHLLVILSKSEYFKEAGRAWHSKTIEDKKVQELADLIRESYKKPSLPKRITINDGMHVRISLIEDSTDIHLFLKEFEDGMIEDKLIKKTLQFVNELVQDPILKKYLNEFGGLSII